MRKHGLLFCFVGLLGLALSACQRPALPDPASETYQEVVTLFYSSLAALQAGENLGAEAKLQRITQLAPGEPAAWLNLGVKALRENDFALATERLTQAATLAPDNSTAQVLLGLTESNQGNTESATTYFRRAVELAPSHPKALFALAKELEQQGREAVEITSLYNRLLEAYPTNIAALLERLRWAALQNDTATIAATLVTLSAIRADWPEEAQTQFMAVQEASTTASGPQLSVQINFLRNLLLTTLSFRQDLRVIQTPAEEVGDLVLGFVKLPTPSSAPAAPDTALTFAQKAMGTTAATWVGSFWYTGEGAPLPLVAEANRLRIGDTTTLPLSPAARTRHSIAPLDYNYDFFSDIAVADASGFRLFEQDSTGTFTDITRRLGLPLPMTTAPYSGAWPADIDTEGDLDIVLGVPNDTPLVLRNNADGTFATQQPFADVRDVRDFGWADLDGDGDPDAALLDGSGTLHVYTNERLGRLVHRPVPSALGTVVALALVDVDGDATLDVVTLRNDGILQSLTDTNEGRDWIVRTFTEWQDFPVTDPGFARLFAADLDNNGGFDLLASTATTSFAWLSDEAGGFRPLTGLPTGIALAVADFTNDGALDVAALTADNEPMLWENQPTKEYRWQRIRSRAANSIGDQRINSFAIGGEMEIRSGLLFQKQPIQAPVVHFGLGTHPQSDVVRIIWPNGDIQAEFDLAADQTVLTPQRLKGSCPWLFTYNGTGMQFVTDFIWRSPLGLRLNAQETADVMTTEDWVKIRGDQLVPKDGHYDIRITAELWETHFFDHVSLLVVDHPVDTEIFVDERVTFPPEPLAVRVTHTPQPIAQAWDDLGNDVTSVLASQNNRYVDSFGLGTHQGLTRDHYVEIDLGKTPTTETLWLIAHGWVRPTDTSINVAISQGTHAPPQSLSLEIPDGKGDWQTARANLGFPAGKTKTILLDLTDVFEPQDEKRLRLRTNMEIYWDQIRWATGISDAQLQTQRLAPSQADLRYRGFSEISRSHASAPEVPTYDRLDTTAPIWQDLIGYYTRFGDVRELLDTVDDRYVIMNAGDEMRFAFAAPLPPPEGWTRNFILIGDGWVKDGDLNTIASKTVRPLPTHTDPTYDEPLTVLTQDPVYQQHPNDWHTYHTRYITPQRFRTSLATQYD